MHFHRISLFFAFFLCLTFNKVFAHCGCQIPLEGRAKENSISSAPLLNSPTASTLGKKHASAGFTFTHLNFNEIPAQNAHRLHEQGRDVHGKRHEETYNIHVGYGILDDLDVYLVIPIVSKTFSQIDDHGSEAAHAESHEEEGANVHHGESDHHESNDSQESHKHSANIGRRQRASGFGDMRLLAKYRFWKKYFEAGLIAGIKFPTGATANKSKDGSKYETEQQPGTGSWDGEFGLTISRNFKQRISVASSFQYFLKGEGAQDRKLGDVFRYSLGSSIALRKLGKYPNANLSLELNHEWTLRDHSRTERRVFDSGGTAVFITPGVSASVTKNISLFWAMPFPIYQNLGGEHEEVQLGMLAGINFYI